MDDVRRSQPRGAVLLGVVLLLLAGCAVPDGPREMSDQLVATIWGEVLPWTIAFSADGTSAAYVTRKEGRAWVVSGNWKSAAFESVGSPSLSADGRVVAFEAARDGRTVLYKNDTPIFAFTEEWALKGGPLVSADGSVVAILVGNAKAAALVLNGKIQKVFQGTTGRQELVGNGLNCAFILKSGGKVCAVVNDTPGPLYDSIFFLSLSEDGKTVAYMAYDDGRQFTVHGSRVFPTDRGDILFFLTKDGKKLGSAGWDDPDHPTGVRIVDHGRVGRTVRIMGNPTYSPDGRHVTYMTCEHNDKECVAIDDQFLDAGGEIRHYPTFLGDGDTVGCGIQKGTELRWKTFMVQ